MSDSVSLRHSPAAPPPSESPITAKTDVTNVDRPNVPKYSELERGLTEASYLVDDIVLKKYLYSLDELEVIPLDESLKKISDIRLFKVTEMIYRSDEYSTYKFASVFNAVQSLNCGVFLIADSDGQKTDFYMGVRSLDNERTTKSLKDTLRNALCGQFPGVKSVDLLDPQAELFLDAIPTKNITSVSCIAKNKDEDFNDNERFIQGLEKLALAMQGQVYTAIILAKSTPAEQLEETRRAYETLYTQLSPFVNMQLSYGTNTALSISNAFSHGTSFSSTHSTQKSKSTTYSTSKNHSTSKADTLGTLAKTLGAAALGVAGLVAAPLTGGASIAAAVAIGAGNVAVSAITPKTKTEGTGESKSHGATQGESFGETQGETNTDTHTEGLTTGSSNNTQLTVQNKSLLDTLQKIDLQLKRIDECESVGMWECAAYFLSDTQETAEMAAGTYKALMKGETSGVETSAINFWGRQKAKQLPLIREYITHFVHPVFMYHSETLDVPVTASSLVSSNELAIHMGLPRKSVCGFPVIEHADFGKEVVRYGKSLHSRDFGLGKVFSMGTATETDVILDCQSLTMHTFVTGSTGSGKSNTTYEILNQLRKLYSIPFLVVEPAKGEYKNVFGQFSDVTVYGTNPKKTAVLKINPFRFPADVHVLEHLDRLVEIFNVCWPMYAAMPAILKEAMERAYEAAGWNLSTSENAKGDKYPNFTDLLEQIETVIDESRYSADSKGDYSGALLTRVRSLTNGLNSLIFCNDDLTDSELFDKSVIVDLSRVGSVETKSLIMGLLVMRLNEYRMASGRINSPLAHVTVLEEAHNLLKRTSTEQSSDGANLLGKSVELLANSIAEMRTYGEGFIIADQSPGLLDMSVIRNTNTKIILRLPDRSDRELVGFAAGLKAEQIDELAKLKQGVAAVYQNDWVEPILVQINKCGLIETPYDFAQVGKQTDVSSIRTQLINMLIQGRVRERLDFSVDEIEKGLSFLGISSSNQEFVEELVDEYRQTGKLEIWQDERLRKLSKRVVDILGVRAQVENCVFTARDNDELTDQLAVIAKKQQPGATEDQVLALSQCMMRDMCAQQTDLNIRQQIYEKWFAHILERGTVR